MALETEEQKREIQRWSRLAIQLIGAADSGNFDHITTAEMVRELQGHDVFASLDSRANFRQVSGKSAS